MNNEPYDVSESGELSAGEDGFHSTDEIVLIKDNIDCNDITQIEVEEINRKRHRMHEENSSDEGWQAVSRGRKASRRTDNDEKIEILVTSSAILPKQFALARLFKENKISGIKRVKYIHQFKMLITFEDDSDADFCINCKAFSDMGWRCQRTLEVNTSYGVIRDIELDVAEEDIIKDLSCDVEVLSAKRLNKKQYNGQINTGWVKCEVIRIAFRGSSLPPFVYIHGLRVKVFPYIFPVTQCSRCWKYGHSRLQCPSTKVVCPKCAKNHENCEIKSFICINCTGNHMALQKVCPVFKKERKIRELMSEFNCTYRKALSLYAPPSSVYDKSQKLILSDKPQELTSNGEKQPCTAGNYTSGAMEENIVHTQRKEKLMSQLFTEPEYNNTKDIVETRKNNRRRRQTARSETSFPSGGAPLPMESDNSEPEQTTPNNGHAFTDSENIKDLSFIRLLIKMYQIIKSRNALEDKIQQIFTILKKWILHNVLSGFTAESLFNVFFKNG